MAGLVYATEARDIGHKVANQLISLDNMNVGMSLGTVVIIFTLLVYEQSVNILDL